VGIKKTMKKQEDKLASDSHGPVVQLTLLATTDLHASVQPYNYYLDKRVDAAGLACIATLVDRIRAETPNCLLFDNGDTLQGTPLGDYAAKERLADGRPHPMIAAMNALGYDAATLGNHDFNYGLAFLTQALQGADYPVVLANVSRADGAPFLPPTAMLTRNLHDAVGAWHKISIGVIGLVPPQVTTWDKQILAGVLDTQPIVETAARCTSDLRAEGADIVVALCHSGLGPETDRPDLENAIRPLARLAGLDAIIAGHSHEVIPGPERSRSTDTPYEVPIVQPGAYGSHLGQITLTLHATDTGWQVTESSVRTHPIIGESGDPVPASDRLMQVSATDHMATLGYIRRRIGESTRPLTSYFAQVSNTAAIALIAEAQRAAAAQALAGHPLQGMPLLSVAAPFKAGGRGGTLNYTDIPAGPLSIRNIADLYIYPNRLQILSATGVEILNWLERSACAFHRITPGSSDQRLIDHRFASYNFDVMTGLSYVIDPTEPARFSATGEDRFETPGRIRDLAYQGCPVDPTDRFLVATNSYRAAGGGHFDAPTRCDVILDPHQSIQDVLIAHVAAHVPISPEPLATWRFADLPGTTVIVETGRGARMHDEEFERLRLEPAGYSPEGFARFTMQM
jgi:2',3'-cyclic-nucleotide 2'-phosphodiesterase / 3'-nucleotidase